MTVCPKCKGNGEYFKAVLLNGKSRQEILVKCDMCHGTGKVSQTNDEWRKTCSTEEFAEALTKVVLNIVAWNNDPKPSEVRNVLKSWLKQPHKRE